MTGRTLIAGVGNIFLGDDGFGVEAARRLATAGLPDWVTVADYGTSGMHLAYDLSAGFDTTIIIDAAPRGGEPGTITVLEAEPGPADGALPGAPDGALPGPADGAGPGTPAGAELESARGAGAGVPAPAQEAGRGQSQEAGQAQETGQAHAEGARPGVPLGVGRMFDAHGMQPDMVLSVLDMLGAPAGRILVVGCEPASTDYQIGLSEPVMAAVDEAVRIVMDLVAEAAASGGSDHEGMSHVPRHSG